MAPSVVVNAPSVPAAKRASWRPLLLPWATSLTVHVGLLAVAAILLASGMLSATKPTVSTFQFIDRDDDAEAVMKELAELTGGRYRYVQRDDLK